MLKIEAKHKKSENRFVENVCIMDIQNFIKLNDAIWLDTFLFFLYIFNLLHLNYDVLRVVNRELTLNKKTY